MCSNHGLSYEEYVAQNLLSLAHDAVLGDVTFIVEGEQRSGVRALFAANSLVFRRMLFGAMMESNPSNEVLLSDLSVAAFDYLRATFYNVHSALTPQIVVDVLFAAQKYLIAPLRAKCMAFIASMQDLADWYHVLRQFESSGSTAFLEELFGPETEEQMAYILQFKSAAFIESELFEQLRPETVAIVIGSDFLAAKEHEIWEALLRWTRTNAVSDGRRAEAKEDGDDGAERKETDSDTLGAAERAMLKSFAQWIRFSQMDSAYFREHIVDKELLTQRQVIDIMFCRENCSKWKSPFNDSPRRRPHRLDTFRIDEVVLSVEEVAALRAGDAVDFRDSYGLFCSATVLETEHSEHRIKIHYNNWGSTYDEWFCYEVPTAPTPPHRVAETQQDVLRRIARHQSVTARKANRAPFKEKVAAFKRRGFRAAARESDVGDEHRVEVSLPTAFWRKNEHLIPRCDRRQGRWLCAKIVAFKTAKKYTDHLKVAIDVNGEEFTFWVHPDNADEIRPIGQH